MILTCPNCSMRYSLSATAIGSAGRKVRCASCGHNWLVDEAGTEQSAEQLTQEPAAPPSPEPVLAEPEPEPEPVIRRDPKVAQAIRARREAERQRQRKIRVTGVWAGIAASFVLILTGAWIFRVDVVRVWPNTASAYAALGGKVNYYGLEIQNITAIRKISGGANVLQTSGQVVNVSNKTQPVPLLEAQLVEPDGTPVFTWVIEPEQSKLDVGASLDFVSQLRDPPPGALDFEIKFVDERAVVSTETAWQAESEPASP